MIRISPTLSTSMLDNELVLLDSATGTYFGLNPVASRIFQLLKETGDAGQTVAALVSEFEASEEKLKADVASFVRLLEDKGLILSDAA
jgi:hypothetical protein